MKFKNIKELYEYVLKFDSSEQLLKCKYKSHEALLMRASFGNIVYIIVNNNILEKDRMFWDVLLHSNVASSLLKNKYIPANYSGYAIFGKYECDIFNIKDFNFSKAGMNLGIFKVL